MHLTIDHHCGVPVSSQLVEQIKYLVVSGRLDEGQTLPSVRVLAAQLTLNPTTVARVYRQLEAERVIYTQAGRGTFVAAGETGLTLDEKRRRLQGDVRRLIVEAGRIGMAFEQLVHQVEREIAAIERDRRPTSTEKKS